MDEIAILLAGSVEYDAQSAAVSIEELIDTLTDMQDQGATKVVLSSGNSRGAQYQRLNVQVWSWDNE